jgi:hypothetical protein
MAVRRGEPFMNQELAYRMLSELIGWTRDEAMREFAWLGLIARLKYDGYRGYVAGARFFESLIDWLQQFEKGDRAAAYAFVRRRLIYVGPYELQHLVDLFFPETVQRLLRDTAAKRLQVPPYRVWSNADAAKGYNRLLRQSLFLGMSDGARIDAFRRTNVGRVKNEQVWPAMDVDDERWDDAINDLRNDLGDSSAQFATVFLIDDFVASGLTLLRKEGGEWKGKLPRLWKKLKPLTKTHLESGFELVVHHYIAGAQAEAGLLERHRELVAARGDDWFGSVSFTFGTVFPDEIRVQQPADEAFVRLVDKHYNKNIMTKSMLVGGEDGRLGFSACGLPLVLEHNTPNNSVALLWAEADSDASQPEMRPLFRRRQRHL